MRVEHFVEIDGRRMRLGFTTGTCAALAAGVAARALLSGFFPEEASLITPKGIEVVAEILFPELREGRAACAVRKDAGDDPDVTDGALVQVTVAMRDEPGILIDGGAGVGRVTRPGLDQPVGEAAINSGPRAMIAREVESASREFAYAGGWTVTVAIPGGKDIAKRTFNPELGIVGGLSVIGTSGIVEPMSTRAVVDTFKAEFSMLRAEGETRVLVTPGNYGGAFVRDNHVLSRWPRVKIANYVGEAVDAAAGCGFTDLMLVGHVGKLVKVAGGIMDTHSRVADCRLEMIALQAALAGCDGQKLRTILACTTVDAALDEVSPEMRPVILDALVERMEMYVNRRAKGRLACGVVAFSTAHQLFSTGAGALRLLKNMENG